MAKADTPEVLALKHTLWMALAGLLAALIALMVTVLILKDSPNADKLIPAALGGILTLIGTLVGAVAGHSGGAAQGRAVAAQADGLREQLRTYERELPTQTADIRKRFDDVFRRSTSTDPGSR
jgi:hypothetical protein